jgi:hypothetical protein
LKDVSADVFATKSEINTLFAIRFNLKPEIDEEDVESH